VRRGEKFTTMKIGSVPIKSETFEMNALTKRCQKGGRGKTGKGGWEGVNGKET